MKVKRIGTNCVTWDRRVVATGEEIEVDDDLGAVLLTRADEWEAASGVIYDKPAAKPATKE